MSSENGRRRVVITGLGAVTPLGPDVETTWDNLTAGRSGAGPITQFDATDFATTFACEASEFDATQYIDRKQARRMDRFAHLIVAAARQAEADSGLEVEKEPDRIGAAVATGIGGLKAFQDCYDQLLARGPDRVNPFSIPEIIPNMGAAWVSMELGTKGPLWSQCTACAASNMAIGDGMDAIRLGRADVMLCGGTEAPITTVGIAGFGAMRALSRRNDAPEKASRPFDAGRDGFVMGEAGAILVLEELEHAQARGAKIYAELLGYGLSSDATHITEPDPTGENPARAMTDGVHRRGHRAVADRLHQRARHLDAARRLERDARDQARARRGDRAEDAGLVDEGRDRALPGRGGRGRGDLHDAGRQGGRAAADDQLRRARSRPATSTTSRTRPARRTSRSACRTRSASAGTTPASCCGAGTADASRLAARVGSPLWRRTSRTTWLKALALVFALASLTINFGLIDLIDGFTGYVDQARNQVLDVGWGAVFGVILPLGLLASFAVRRGGSPGFSRRRLSHSALALAGAAGRGPEVPGARGRHRRASAAVLLALHPARRRFLERGRHLEPVLLALAAVAAVPSLVYAWRMASAQRRDRPAAEPFRMACTTGP